MIGSSILTCTGQLFWKLAASQNSIWLIPLGFAFYGCGAVLMIFALRFGELSILHPMLSAGYVLSVVLGSIVFHESITVTKVVGIAVIILGLICLSAPERQEK